MKIDLKKKASHLSLIEDQGLIEYQGLIQYQGLIE